MSGRHIVWTCLSLVLALVQLLPTTLRAQTTTSAPQPRPLSYRLIYAPFDQISNLAQGEYRTMKRDSFFAAVRMLGQHAPAVASQPAQLQRAVYRAKFDGRRLTEGTASLQIQTNLAEASLLPLGAISQTISSPRWADRPEEPAVVGTDQQGALHVVVPSSGELWWNWTQDVDATDPDRVSVHLSLPQSPLNRLELVVPSIYAVSGDRGVARVTQTAAADSQAADAETAWTIELGGQSSVTLTFARKGTSGFQPRLSQSSVYRLAEQGLEVTTELTLSCDATSIDELTVQLDRPLHLTDAWLNNQPLSWTSTTDSTSEGPAAAIIGFKEPLVGQNRTIRLRAIAPPESSPTWQLPRIVPQQVRWEQEDATLEFTAPLRLSNLELEGVRRTSAEARDFSPTDTPAVGLQFLAPLAKVSVTTERVEPQLVVSSGYTLRAASAELSCELRTAMQTTDGEIFELQTPLTPGWTIESVETEDAQQIHDWQVIDVNDQERELLIRFTRAITSQTITRLRLVARHRLDVAEGLHLVSQLQPTHFTSQVSRDQRSFMAIHSESDLQRLFTNDYEVTWLSLDDLDVDETPLLDIQAGDPIILLDGNESQLAVAFQPLAPNEQVASARLRTVVRVTPQAVYEQYRVQITQPAATGQPIRFRSTRPRVDDVRWYPESDPHRVLAARRVSADDDDGELWQIEWTEPTDGVISIIGERRMDRTDDFSVGLIELINAQTQEATIAVEATSSLRVKAFPSSRLSPIPTYRTTFRELPVETFAYRYTPGQEVLGTDQQLRLLIDKATHHGQQLCIWNLDLVTQLERSGTARQTATLKVENLGETHLHLQLPGATSVRRALIDGVETNFVAQNTDVEIPLPLGDRFPVVSLVYESSGEPLSTRQWLPFAAPQTDAPILSRTWHVWTPPGYQAQRLERPQGMSVRAQLRRVFGPLLRPADERPFDLFDWSDYRKLWSQLRTRETLATDTIALVEACGAESATTWSSALHSQMVVDAVSDSSRSIRIDVAGLTDQGVTPQTRLPTSAAATAWLRGIDRLRQAGLAIIDRDQEVILATDHFADEHRDALQSVYGQVVFTWINHDRLPLDLPATQAWPELATAESWTRSASPWPAVANEVTPLSEAGWTVIELTPLDADHISVYHTTPFYVATAAAFIFCLAAAWTRSLRPLVPPLLILTTLMFALLVPDPLVSIGRAGFWGALLGWCLPCFRPHEANRRSPSTLTRFRSFAGLSPTVQTTAWLVWIIGVIALSRWAFGQEPVNGPPEPATSTFEVYLPIDANEQPDGDYLFVPLDLHRTLQEQTRLSSARAPAWLLQSADYDGVLSRSSATSLPTWDRLTCSYLLYVTDTRQPIRFPLDPQAAATLDSEGQLNGRQTELEWDAERGEVVLPIDQTGVHRLQLTFRPSIRITRDGARFEFPIPRSPTSTFRMNSLESLGSFRIETATGTMTGTDSPGQPLFSLGSTNRLAIEWNANGQPSKPPIEWLNWLRLAPGEVRLDLRLYVDPLQWSSPTLTLELDDRMQPIPDQGDQPISMAAEPVRGVRLLQYAVPQGEAGPAFLELRFRLNSASGVGNVYLPSMRILEAPTGPRWLAISTDPQLIVRPNSARGVESLPVSDFNARWASVSPPQSTFRLTPGHADWSCSTTLQASVTQVEYETAFEVSLAKTRIVSLGRFSAQGPGRLEQRIEIPAGYQLNSATLIRDSDSRVIASSSPNQGIVILNFDQPINGTYQLLLVGEMDANGAVERLLDRPQWMDASVTDELTVVYRSSDVTLSSPSLDSESGMNETDLEPVDPLIAGQLGLSRRFASFRSFDPADRRTVQVQPNQPKIIAELANKVTRDNGVWYLQLEAQMQVQGGILDALRFEIPEVWIAGLKNELDARILYGQSPVAGTGRVTIWPAEPLEPSAPMWFSGPIPTTLGEPLSVPNVRLLEPGTVTRTLQLPTWVDGQPIDWRLDGLERIDDPVTESTPSDDTMRFSTYRIVGDRFQAVRLPTQKVAGSPRVTWCDVHFLLPGAAHSDGRQTKDSHYRAMAVFDFEPNGVSSCQLQLPDQATALRVMVDDRQQEISGNGDPSQLPVDMVSYDLPQRISVLYEGPVASLDSPDGRVPVAPQLLQTPTADDQQDRMIDVGKTTWTVYTTQDDAAWHDIPLPPDGDALDQSLLRLEQICTTVEIGSQISTEQTKDDLTSWFQRWSENLQAVIQRAEFIGKQAGRSAEQLQQQIEPYRQRHFDAATRLDLMSVYERVAARRNVTDAVDVWNQSVRRIPAKRWSFRGASPTLPRTFHSHKVPLSERPGVLACLLAAVGLTLTGLVYSRRIEPTRWIGLVVALVGVAWWLFLQPSLFGWLLVALSVLLTLGLRRPLPAGA